MLVIMPAHSSLALARWLPLLLAACSPTIEPPADTETSSTTAATTAATEPAASTGPGMTNTSGLTVTTSGADSGSSTDDGEVLFLLRPDGSCAPPGTVGGPSPRCSFECDVSQQDCPRGEKCMPWANDGGNAWNASRCSPIDPMPVPPGGACTVEGSGVSGIDDCALGSMCWGVDPRTLQGTCLEFCDPLRQPSQTCAAPTTCVSLNEGFVPVCLTPCDPLQPAACPADAECRNLDVDGGFYCLPSVGGEVMGSSRDCDAATCSPAQLCVDAELLSACEAGSCCTGLCDTNDPEADAQCAALDPALVCVPFYEPGAAPAGLEPVGVCILPM